MVHARQRAKWRMLVRIPHTPAQLSDAQLSDNGVVRNRRQSPWSRCDNLRRQPCSVDLEPSLSVVSHSRVLTTMDVMMSGAEVETIAED